MKLDDEMRAALSGAIGTAEWDRGMSARDMRIFAAGYRMGLERAAKVAEQHFIYGHAVAGPGFAAVCATKIRALGDGA